MSAAARPFCAARAQSSSCPHRRRDGSCLEPQTRGYGLGACAATGSEEERELERDRRLSVEKAITYSTHADAQRRGHPVALLVTETTGALSSILTARCEHSESTHARRPPMIPPGLASRGPPPKPAAAAAAVQHNARTHSGPPSTRATVAMDGGVADSPTQPVLPSASLHTIARLPGLPVSRQPFSRTQLPYSSLCSRHELQAHHGHVALVLNRPRAAPAMV
jgi:hypothetical protein